MLHRHGSLAHGSNAFLSEMRSKTQLHLHVKDALGAVYTLYLSDNLRGQIIQIRQE